METQTAMNAQLKLFFAQTRQTADRGEPFIINLDGWEATIGVPGWLKSVNRRCVYYGVAREWAMHCFAMSFNFPVVVMLSMLGTVSIAGIPSEGEYR